HGSIVAREYGIPAVMGTGNGTERIGQGQTITVDGDRGEVGLGHGRRSEAGAPSPRSSSMRAGVVGVGAAVAHRPTGRPIPALGFDALTPLLDRALNLLGLGDHLNAQMLDLLDSRSGETLLDVGCGTGALLLLARQRCPESTLLGIDADRKILGLAR